MTSTHSVREALTRWLAAFNARDIETLMALYDDEIVYTNANAPIRRGKAEVRASFESAFAGEVMKLLFAEETFFEGRDLALIGGKFHFCLGEDRATPGGSGRVTLLYRRNAEGRWFLLYDTDNHPPDVSAKDFETL